MNKVLRRITIFCLGCFTFLGSLFLIQKSYLPVISKVIKDYLFLRKVHKISYHKKQKTKYRDFDNQKFDNPDLSTAFYDAIRTGINETHPTYAPNYKFEELSRLKKENQDKLKTARSSIIFKERGPGNVPGRTRAILIDPRDSTEQTWLAGSTGGGVWKTTNGGQKWTALTENLPNLTISALAQSSSNPNVIYAGTGEGGFIGGSGGNGDGVFKSTDGGQSWQQLPYTAEHPLFQNINRIIISPENPNLVLVCASSDASTFLETGNHSAIFRSEDGGNTWQTVFESEYLIQQLTAPPNRFDEIYASVNKIGVVKSTDKGKTWFDASEGLALIKRIELAISPSNTDIIYASAESTIDATGSSIYMSSDAGKSWHLLLPPEEEINYNLLGNQGGYDNTIMVHPFDPYTVYVGGVDLWKIEVRDDPSSTESFVRDVKAIHTQSFIDDDIRLFSSEGVNVSEVDFVKVEIRFGKGKEQLAHRFTVPEGATSGVPFFEHTYQDYVTVPFEVWDVTNNKQLMVSFRDQDNNGIFNLQEKHDTGREYLFIHAFPYEEIPNEDITKDGGYTEKNLYLLWMAHNKDIVWDNLKIPDAKIVIDYGIVSTKRRNTFPVSDNYFQLDDENRGKNSFSTGTQHPDHHQLLPIHINRKLQTFAILNTNDGGVFISYEGENPGFKNHTWQMVGKTYNTTQFYSADRHPTRQFYMGGAQDQGTWLFAGEVLKLNENASNSSKYTPVLGGDGFEMVWHKAEATNLIVSSQFNNFYRSIGLTPFESATTYLTDIGFGKAPFYSRLANVPKAPDMLFAVGATGVWKSNDFGGKWTVSIPPEWVLSPASDVDISPVDPQIVWAGSGMGGSWQTYISTDGGRNFSPTASYEEIGVLTSIHTHPTLKNSAFILFSTAGKAKILQTNDLGKTWTDITAFESGKSKNGFPDVAVFSLVVMPHNPEIIWAGTEIGIIESQDGGQNWHLLEAFISASVWDMKVIQNEVVIATHGRGIWTATIPDISTLEYTNTIVRSPKIHNVKQNSSSLSASIVDILIDLPSSYEKTEILINGDIYQTIEKNVSPIYHQQIEVNTEHFNEKAFTIQLYAYENNKIHSSNIIDFHPAHQVTFKAPQLSYSTDFEHPDSDFILDGFLITQEEGFSNTTLCTPHPYQTGAAYTLRPSNKNSSVNLTATLTVPIKIQANNATISFKEVVLVEAQEDGSNFGEEDFKDYVIVEASKDLKKWIALGDGYDVCDKPDWLELYNTQTMPTELAYKKRQYNLLEHFKPQDIVYFRFRLFSDSHYAYWGWAIDDLNIQTNTPVQALASQKEQIKVFPNPTTGRVHIYPQNSSYNTVKVFNHSGEQVAVFKPNEEINLMTKPKGIYFLEIETENGLEKEKIVVY